MSEIIGPPCYTDTKKQRNDDKQKQVIEIIMRYSGTITNWSDEKGYGFVVQNGGGSRVFVHIKSFACLTKRPSSGDVISYKLQKDAMGRLNAIDINFAGFSGISARLWNKVSARIVFLAVFVVIMGVGWRSGHIPFVILLGYGIMSVATFLVYGMDKYQAVNELWRTPEAALHLLAFLGGWPGALFAQRLFHHKSRKQEFQWKFWGTVLLNGAIFAWLLYSGKAYEFETIFLREAGLWLVD